jgi:hypothetical protein
MEKELEDILKEAGAIKLKVAQNFVRAPNICKVSKVYSNALAPRVAIITSSLLYIPINLDLDESCKYDVVTVHKSLPLTEDEMVYVVPEDQIGLLQKRIPELKKYF